MDVHSSVEIYLKSFVLCPSWKVALVTGGRATLCFCVAWLATNTNPKVTCVKQCLSAKFYNRQINLEQLQEHLLAQRELEGVRTKQQRIVSQNPEYNGLVIAWFFLVCNKTKQNKKIFRVLRKFHTIDFIFNLIPSSIGPLLVWVGWIRFSK